MRKISTTTFLFSLAVLLLFSNSSIAQVNLPWSDDFQAYPNGTVLNGQNGWLGWGNDPAFAATTTTNVNPSRAVEITGTDDAIVFFNPVTSGQWSARACQLIPTGLTGESFFIMMNQYDHPGATWNWSTQVQFEAGQMIDDAGVSTQAYIADQWTEIRVEIDLDNDTQAFFYNGAPFYSGVWNGYQSGAGTGSNAIEVLDLFSNNGSSVFYDDISITAGPGTSAPCQVFELPVEIGSFETRVDDGNVELAWTTLSEENNSGFEVELAEGANFRSLGFVDGNGNSTETINYSFTVSDLDPGNYRFRLKQIDFDGDFEYSDLVEAIVTVPEGYLISDAYPNPFNPSTRLEIGVEQSQFVSLDVYNSVGQKVASPFAGEIAANQMQSVVVRLDGLPSGQYILAVSGNNWVTHRVVTMTK